MQPQNIDMENQAEEMNQDEQASVGASEQVKPSITPERLARITRVLSCRQKDLTLVLANIHDPHNVSAIYRSCDAFGVAEVHLYYTNTAFPTLGKKTSASARKWVDTVRHSDRDEMLAKLRASGHQVLATSCSPKAHPVSHYDLTKPTAIIMGNEHSGVDQELVDVVDGEVYIPMYGMIQSFNVSVAAAVLLSEASRQRVLAGMYDQPTYDEEEYAAKLAKWIEK